MDVILFNPPRYRNGNYHKFNNALLWIASYLYQRNVEVRIVPLNNEHFEETIKNEIKKYRPKYAAISCKWWDTLFSSSHIADLIKKYDPRIITITGGQTASYFAKEIVVNTHFDVVIRGDGEVPLYRLVTGQESVNCVFKKDHELIPVRNQYVQTKDSLKDVYLANNLEDIVSDTSILNSYIWTGKGCNETCVYCAGNIWNNVQSFGRNDFIYRPIDVVLHDIEVLSKYPNSTRITFDFDPLRGKVQENYHLELFNALEKKKYNCYFCSWSLPSKELIDALAETFNFVELCIDIQSPSERLRKLLGKRRFLKRFFSDKALEELLVHTQRYDNFAIDLSALMGLPFEQDEDVRAIKSFSDYFYDKFTEVRYPYVSPMNVEPGSLLLRNPVHYDMVLFRKSFEDFMQYTKRSFMRNINCYQPESYGHGIFHPLGVVPVKDFEHGEIFKVYEMWKGIQEHIDQRSREKALIRARKYKKYGLLKAGILGGIDNTMVSAQSELE
jgi:radical SAM superfamily enzyme YgiQ (UPF0313 family)